ncbi:uncharacterized protein B0J16DRAFT_412212 [Fusarium flagelliforme]|uniref:CCHC-type domain-containing protein n=1 Tax=Fusarium flagelliforme TaxID=2675880 RepID=A0A395M933_9HYPO|nr:uncharacterized protein B0J16DRAFT_412212 [Fusarium flagelliforme]KAH7193641.1 hypothetical protein B0J16DRAFT_412212 [Fusarium flagelliforme]RFN44375.1 hypothetical protein FIE12Z_11417 [Fusarium flagelliforme]
MSFVPFSAESQGSPEPKSEPKSEPPISSKKRKNAQSGKPKCYVCQAVGHLAKDCPVEEDKRNRFMQQGAEMAERLMNPHLRWATEELSSKA